MALPQTAELSVSLKRLITVIDDLMVQQWLSENSKHRHYLSRSQIKVTVIQMNYTGGGGQPGSFCLLLETQEAVDDVEQQTNSARSFGAQLNSKNFPRLSVILWNC